MTFLDTGQGSMSPIALEPSPSTGRGGSTGFQDSRAVSNLATAERMMSNTASANAEDDVTTTRTLSPLHQDFKFMSLLFE